MPAAFRLALIYQPMPRRFDLPLLRLPEQESMFSLCSGRVPEQEMLLGLTLPSKLACWSVDLVGER